MKVRVALILTGCLLALPARGQTNSSGNAQPPSRLESVVPMPPEKPDPAKDAAIRHLLDITNESQMADSISGMISTQVRSLAAREMKDDRLQKFMVEFDQQFRASVPASKVVDAVVPIYSQEFSMEEIQGLIKFYESPLGQKMVQTMGQVSRDTQQAGFSIEKQAAIATLQKMTTDYPEMSKFLAAPGAKPAEGQPAAGKPSLAPTPTAPKPSTPQQ